MLNMAVNCNTTATLSIWYCYKENQNTVSPLLSCSCNRHAWGSFIFLQFTPILNIFFLFEITYQRNNIALEHLYFFLQQPPQWIPCHFALALSWVCAHVLYLSVSLAVFVFAHTGFTTRDHSSPKTCFQRNDWCFGVCLSLSWLWHPINVGLRRYSIAQDIKLFTKNVLIFRRVQVSLPAPHTVWEFQGQQLAENSMKLQWLIYCNRWQETELS